MPDHVHDGLDDNAKSHAEAFQPGFLRDCAEAAEAGFPPEDADPVFETDPAAIDEAWAEAGQ